MAQGGVSVSSLGRVGSYQKNTRLHILLCCCVASDSGACLNTRSCSSYEDRYPYHTFIFLYDCCTAVNALCSVGGLRTTSCEQLQNQGCKGVQVHENFVFRAAEMAATAPAHGHRNGAHNRMYTCTSYTAREHGSQFSSYRTY